MFDSIWKLNIAEWSSGSSLASKLKVVGSIPSSATIKKKQAVSSAAVLVTARIRINLVIGINVGFIMILRPGRRINLLSTERHNGQGFHGSCRANL